MQIIGGLLNKLIGTLIDLLGIFGIKAGLYGAADPEHSTGNGNTAECEYSRAGDLWDPQSYGPATGLEWAPDMDNM